MKRATAVLLASAPLPIILAAAAPPGSYGKIDRCLADREHAWNYRTNACEAAPSGPVDRLYVDKSEHWLAAYRDGRIVREFRVGLGRGGLRPKERSGDGRVPEGLYTINAHNPASAYHLALRINYPTADQVSAAEARGVKPGGDIMIHGLPNGSGAIGSRQHSLDWTDGCIALTDAEMDWLYNAVPDGTPIEIEQ